MTLVENDVFVGSNWVADRLEEVQVVDVRAPRDYRDSGHVPGAVNVPYESLRDPGGVAEGMLPDASTFASVLEGAGIEPESPIVAYDGDSGVYAARFLLTAATYGHDGPLYLLNGDFSVWRSNGSVEFGSVEREETTYPVDAVSSSLLADRDTVREARDDGALLVDTRTPAEYASAHIPEAVQLGWETLVDDETNRLRPHDEIEQLLHDRGITRDESIILYCNTARRLSHTFAVLRHLGFDDVRFYEGSLTDWIRAESAQWDPEFLHDQVRDLAAEGPSALARELGEDVFSRLHLVGLYTQKQDGYFMLRTKVPCGQLTAEQAREFGTIAREFATAPDSFGGENQNPEFGDGFLDVTTRQGLQLHWVKLADVPEIWDRFERVGLTTLQASGNTLRNVVTCPATGAGDEHFPVGHIGKQIANRFEGDRELANLPRKLKIGLSGCHENCARSEIQDLGFTPARKDGRDGFHVKVGGGLSDGPRVASDLGIFLDREQVVEFSTAVARLFADHGSYLDTAVNRLRFLVEEWGTERFRKELERYVGFSFEPAGKDLTTDYRGDHVGVHQQPDGAHLVGLNVPTGRLTGEDLIKLADLVDEYGSGEIRTTPNQNLVVPGVNEHQLDSFLDEPLLTRFSPTPGPFTRGIVTCTGAEFCSYGLIETKTRGLHWARDLDDWAEKKGLFDDSTHEAFRIHMSGCSASCALPQVADVGLRGERHRDDEADVPAVDVGLGGDLSRSQFIDWIVGSHPIETVPAAIRRVLLAYDENRNDEESFAEWTERHSIPELATHLRESVPETGSTQKGVN